MLLSNLFPAELCQKILLCEGERVPLADNQFFKMDFGVGVLKVTKRLILAL